MAGRIGRWLTGVRSRIGKAYEFIKRDIRKRPFRNFYLALLVFVLIIVLSSFLQTPPKTTDVKSPQKEVSLYSIGSVPKMTASAQITKTGVVSIVALSGGVVQKIHYHEGDKVSRGNTLVSLSTNYQGGNASSVQRQLANSQYQSAVDTFDQQKDLINGQRDVATKSAENAEKLRDISGESRQTTRELIDLNKALLDTVNTGLTQLPNTAENSEAIAALQGQKAQLLAGLSQAQGSLAAADYQADSNKPPAELARIQKDIALKQLDLQEKMLGVSKEAARLQLQLAQVTEALMFPAAPISGVVQRVFVKEGDVVAPGAQLAVVAQGNEADPITAIAYVPVEVAGKISLVEESVITVEGQKVKAHPYFISTEAVQGNLYAVYYSVPDNLGVSLPDSGYVEIEIPIGYADSTVSAAYVPVDAIYQTEDSAYLFVDSDGKATSRNIALGNVYGGYVAVSKGLNDGDQVIVTRNVVEGDRVQVTK